MKKRFNMARRRPTFGLLRSVCRAAKWKKKEVLIIIGNGFDLHHGIPSSYWHFQQYVAAHDADLLDTLEKYFDPEFLWSDFEATLAWLDTESLIEDAQIFLVPYSAEDWKDAYHHDYEYEIDRVLLGVTRDLVQLFTEWVLQLPVKKDVGNRRINLLRSARFLTFNYTPTLEIVYDIPAGQILYLHHKAVSGNSELILGHGRKPAASRPLTEYEIEQRRETDTRVLGGNQSLEQYFADTYKPIEQVIRDNKDFFRSLRSVDEIHVLGHSLADVDLPYFQQIARAVRRMQVRWTVSYYTVRDILHHRQALVKAGVCPYTITFARIADIYSPQLSLF